MNLIMSSKKLLGIPSNYIISTNPEGGHTGLI